MFGKKNLDVYLLVGIVELIIIGFVMMIGSYLTGIGFANGFLEGNSISVLGFSAMGFVGYAILRIAIVIIIFIVLWVVGAYFSIPWFAPLVLGIILAVFTIDDYHDLIVLQQAGINIGWSP